MDASLLKKWGFGIRASLSLINSLPILFIIISLWYLCFSSQR